MISRGLQEQDLSACLEMSPAHFGLELVSRDQAIATWKKLIECRSFNSVVIEAEPPIAGHRIVGFGASVFVSQTFAEEQISNPCPGLNARSVTLQHSARRCSELRTAGAGRVLIRISLGCV